MSGGSDETNRAVSRAILQNIAKRDQSLREECERLLIILEGSVRELFDHTNQFRTKLAQIFVKQFTEFYCWQGAFRSLTKEEKYANDPAYRNINIDEFIIPIISKVSNISEPHNDFILYITSICRKKQWDKEFGKKWSALKIEKMKEKQKKLDEMYKHSLQEQQKQLKAEKAARQKKKEEEEMLEQKSKKQVQIEGDQSKKMPNKNQQIQKQREVRRSAVNATDQLKKQRFERILKYLAFISAGTGSSSQGQGMMNYSNNINNGNFYIQNMNSVAAQLHACLEKFLHEKIKQVLHVAKIRHDGYKSEMVGNQFRFYGQNGEGSLSAQSKEAVTKIPTYQNTIKFSKLTFPSKLQIYFSTRVQEEKHEEYFKTEVKNKIGDLDKKSDKFLQNYTFDDEKREKEETKVDYGQSKTNRLKITSGCVQWAIENDPFFKDSWVMQKTLIND